MNRSSRPSFGRGVQVWDYFVAHAGPDRASAQQLCRLLEGRTGARVFLDTKDLVAGDPFQSRLKEALSGSRMTVVLISRHTPKAWYQQEEVVLAIELARDDYAAHHVVPVLLRGARKSDTPYGLRRLHALRESDSGLSAVADELHRALTKVVRRSTEMLAGSVRRMDEIWSRAEPAYANRSSRVPEQFRMRYLLDGEDLVAEDQGRELQRITRDQFERKLGREQLEFIEVLERSMEVNKALWKKAYPRRRLSPAEREYVKAAVDAMSDDLTAVLDTVERAGFWLDDHYQMVRSILRNDQ